MRNGNWNLDNLYTSFDSEEYKKDFIYCQKAIDLLTTWCGENLENTENSTQKAEYYINELSTFGALINKLGEYSQLVMSVDATNSVALKNLESIENLDSETSPITTMFSSWIGRFENIDDLINSSQILKEHEFFIKEIAQNNKYLLSQKEEIAISKMKTTGSLSWMKLWDTLTSTLNIDLDGKTYPLPAIRNMAYSSDTTIRKSAYEAELKALESISQTSCATLNSIKGEVITTCKLRGYSSPLEMTLINSRMDKEVLDAMISAMKEYQPILREYLYKKAEILGHKKGLPFYDLFAPIGNIEMTFTYEEAKAFIIENFNTFSTDLGNYAKMAFENSWIDVYPKEGKRGGAFCANLHSIKESRFLTNFSGSFSDVLTLAHELGHGYHGHCLNSQKHLNSDYPMPIAETASTFCETLVKNAALKTASKEEQLVILENDISDNLQIITDILSRFLFEDEVFKRREEGSLSVDELCDIMTNAQLETYGDGLDPDFMHKYMWVVKPHYYDVDFNYYNFPYAFGLLFAKGLYSIFLEKGQGFANDYVKLLSSTGCKNHKDIALMAGIDITNPEFWKSSLNIIKDDVEKYLAL